ncbi:DUF86 domain-containing protein [Candidatus Woesearchaeota archaeon]|jgi:uncharacterized protein YutE (UPF0331/DUF86 family)|nr:DUF86 domain-containing protein [Candidatus Woesearchaeota archaeon]MBT6519943.1 DUF86 domain-containing protein [Candidatus Woesearchaeota archaeon]MBT7367856.1 DUF86 domain-containing protein [Candidatus Woesearchaeota archaeon]
MNQRIKDKISEVEQFLTELESFIPSKFIDYSHDLKTRAACERYFEKIIEAVVDLSFLLIREIGAMLPEDEKGSFDSLKNEGIISEKLCNKLKDAKGMSNIIAHNYGSVDDEIVFNSLNEELITDVSDFLDQISKRKEIKKNLKK